MHLATIDKGQQMKQFSKIFSTFLLAAFANTALAGMIVVNHDEWTLSNAGFSNSPDAGIFADNVAQFFTGGGAGSFHAYSNNFGLTQSSLVSALTDAGHTYSVGSGIDFDVSTLQGFDGIFVAGAAAGLDASVLVDYVNAGGNVYLAGGTGNFGGALGEANFWNDFLNPFGMAFQSPYNLLLSDNFDVSSAPHQIFDGVSTLFENNGNTVLDLVVLDDANIYFDGRYAVYDDTGVAVPEPSIIALFAAGLIGVGFARRRKA